MDNEPMGRQRTKESIYKFVQRSDGSLSYCGIEGAPGHPTYGSTAATPDHKRMSAVLSGSLICTDPALLRVRADDLPPKSYPMPATAPWMTRMEEEVDLETGTLSAFGMFWKREMVSWSGRPMLLGQQSATTPPTNFARQVGIYLLQDGARTIYVGRASDSIYTRLKAHTIDRMGGRWNRFSWFGLRGVGEDGVLLESPTAWSHSVVIETIEALLIESLEPPLNRRRGDGLCGLEYLQIADPTIEVSRKKELLGELMNGAGLGER